VYDYASPRVNAALREIIADFTPDVVHVHNVYGLGSAAIRLASRIAPATVVTLHDYWPIDIAAPSYRAGVIRYPLRARAMSPVALLHRAIHARNLRSARLVAPSAFLARRIGVALRQPVEVIPNATPVPDAPSTLERRMLYVGRLAREKGIDMALPHMVAIAVAAGWQVDVAGDGPLAASLRRSYPSVRFHGSVAPAPLYARAGALIVPSIWPENAPLAVLEGMSYGLPVVASAAGGIPELAEDGESALLFAPGDGDGLQSALQRVVDDPVLGRMLGAAARRRTSLMTWLQVARQYTRLYESAEERSPSYDIRLEGVDICT
jgi:glycosyltransferase involved in cell wall biosynthesis